MTEIRTAMSTVEAPGLPRGTVITSPSQEAPTSSTAALEASGIEKAYRRGVWPRRRLVPGWRAVPPSRRVRAPAHRRCIPRPQRRPVRLGLTRFNTDIMSRQLAPPETTDGGSRDLPQVSHIRAMPSVPSSTWARGGALLILAQIGGSGTLSA